MDTNVNVNVNTETNNELSRKIFKIFCIAKSLDEGDYLVQDAGEVDSKLEGIKICLSKDRLVDLKNLISEALPSRDCESILSLLSEDDKTHDEIQKSISLILNIMLNNTSPVDMLIRNLGGVEEVLNYVEKNTETTDNTDNTETPNIDTENRLRELSSKIVELTDSINMKTKSIENLKYEIDSKEEQIQKLNSELNKSRELISSLELKNKDTDIVDLSDEELEEFLNILEEESDIFVANGIKDYLSNLLDEDNEELISRIVTGLLSAYRNLKGSDN